MNMNQNLLTKASQNAGKSQNLLMTKNTDELKQIIPKEESTTESLPTFSNQSNQIDPTSYPTLQ